MRCRTRTRSPHRLLDALDEEFAYEEKLREGGRNQAAQVEDVYARFTGISGTSAARFVSLCADAGG